MHPPAQATRRAQVVAALADAGAAVDRPPPVHVAVDGCFLQHPEFVGAWDLVVFLRSDPPRAPGPYEDPDRAPAAARYLTQVDPEGAADVVVDLHDPGWPVIRRISPALADRLGAEVFLARPGLLRPAGRDLGGALPRRRPGLRGRGGRGRPPCRADRP